MIDTDDDTMYYFVKDFDKGFYMTVQDYAEWVELFCGKPEETEEGVVEL